MMKGNWQAALYVDERGSAVQRDALTKIFGGRAGGVPGSRAPLIAKVLGVKSVPIRFEPDEKKRRFIIPGLAEMEAQAIERHGDRDVTLENHPLTAVPGQKAVVAKSKRLSLHDQGLAWEFTEKNGYYSPFAYAGP